MKTLLLLLTITSSLFVIGCNSHLKDGNKLLSLIEKYGNENIPCFTVPGVACNSIGGNLERFLNINSNKTFSLVKDAETHKDGRVVFSAPIVNGITETKYFGINVEDLDELMRSIERLRHKDRAIEITKFILRSARNLKLDSDDHYLYNNDGNWELYSENSQSPKDLEALGANLENQSAKILGEKLSTQYGLSVDRAEDVAKNIYAYNKLNSKRSLTEREKNFFSNELLGADFDQVMDTLISGEGMDDLLLQAADINDTTPEQVSAIIRELFL